MIEPGRSAFRDPPAPHHRETSTMRRAIVITLAVLAGISGELLALVSLTRVAGPAAVTAGEIAGKLGFPYDLRWTLFAVVSVAGWVGAVLWTAPDPAWRRMGRVLNLPAATIAGLIVGLDHAGHAATDGPWPVLAFVVGPLITLTSSAMLHVIARMTEATSHRTGSSGVRSGESQRNPGGNRGSGDYEQGESPAADTEPIPLPDQQPDPAAEALAPARTQREQRVRDLAADPDGVPSAEVIRERYGCSERTAFRLRADAVAAREVSA